MENNNEFGEKVIEPKVNNIETKKENMTNTTTVSNNMTTITKGWSWSGSFSTFGTLVASKRWGFLALYIISMMIPIVNFIALILFFILGGIKGKEWLYQGEIFNTEEEKIGAIKAMEAVGFAYFILFLTVVVIYMILISIGYSLLFGSY